MTNSIADVLGGKRYDEPPEVNIIKTYVRKELKSEVSVTIQERQIVITVPSGAFASALRPHLYRMALACNTTKRLMIRISS